MPEALTISTVEIVEATIVAKSVMAFWAIEENTLNAITEAVNSIVEVVEVVNPQTFDAITEVHDSKMVDFDLVDCSMEMFTFWSLAIAIVGSKIANLKCGYWHWVVGGRSNKPKLVDSVWQLVERNKAEVDHKLINSQSSRR